MHKMAALPAVFSRLSNVDFYKPDHKLREKLLRVYLYSIPSNRTSDASLLGGPFHVWVAFTLISVYQTAKDSLFYLRTVLSHWDFFHGKIGLLFPGESQLRQSRATQPKVRVGCSSVSIIHRIRT